jgi:predicted Fe-Mo cluster-binding NifX family protein
MRVCVPTIDRGGPRGLVAWHAGRAPYYTLVNTDTGRATVVTNKHADHVPGRCETAEDLRAHRVDAVVCHGMGGRSIDRLNRIGIVVLASRAETVAAALEAFRTGVLRPLTADACRGGPPGSAHSRTKAREATPKATRRVTQRCGRGVEGGVRAAPRRPVTAREWREDPPAPKQCHEGGPS